MKNAAPLRLDWATDIKGGDDERTALHFRIPTDGAGYDSFWLAFDGLKHLFHSASGEVMPRDRCRTEGKKTRWKLLP
eukprot:SAG22_NODE_5011_length_1108_cov_1.420218_1_plen_76_part_10